MESEQTEVRFVLIIFCCKVLNAETYLSLLMFIASCQGVKGNIIFDTYDHYKVFVIEDKTLENE